MSEPIQIDMFEDFDNLPQPIKSVFEKYEQETLEGFSYDILAKMLTECENLGYTFDYDLDAVPYDLRPINQ